MRRNYFHTCITLVIFILSACHGNGGNTVPLEPLPKATLHGSFDSKFNRYSKGENPFKAPANQKQYTAWRDTVWKGERVHTQILLWTDKEAIGDIKYTINDLKNGAHTIHANQVRLRFGQYVLGDRAATVCGEQLTRENIYIADALSMKPVTTVFQEDPVKLWVTVDVPSYTPAGTYTGSLSVTGSDDTALTFDLDLVVLNRTLPQVSDWTYHLDIWQFPFQLTSIINRNGGSITPFSDEYFRVVTPFYAMLADAGQKAVTTYIKDGAFGKGETMVKWSRNAKGGWKFNFNDFDRYVQEMFNLGIDKQINCFSIVGWNSTITYYDEATNANNTLDYEVGSPEFNEIWEIFLTDFRSHLQQKGWFDKTVLYMDEIRNEEMMAVINLIKAHDASWKIGLAGGETTLEVENSLYDYSTIFEFNRRTTSNTISTFYTSCSQTRPNNYVTMQNTPAEMTWLAWYALAKGYDGYLRWALDYWQSNDPVNAQDGSNAAGDFSFIYRTNNSVNTQPVASTRFELLREGIQDYEKLRILSRDSSLENELAKFTETSATNAQQTVQSAQRVLKQVASK